MLQTLSLGAPCLRLKSQQRFSFPPFTSPACHGHLSSFCLHLFFLATKFWEFLKSVFQITDSTFYQEKKVFLFTMSKVDSNSFNIQFCFPSNFSTVNQLLSNYIISCLFHYVLSSYRGIVFIELSHVS